MSLRVWLPLTKDLHNQGLSNVNVTNYGTIYSSTGGKLGGCYSFDGNDYITISPIEEIIDTTNFSICMWIDLTQISSVQYFLGGASGATGIRYSGGDNKFLIFTSSRDASYTYNFTKINDFVHLAIIKENYDWTIYVNGNKIGSRTLEGSINIDKIGRRNDGYYYKGKINDFRIYDHCLSVDEIKDLAKGLFVHYKLDGHSLNNRNLVKGNYRCTSTNTTFNASGSLTFTLTADELKSHAGENLILSYDVYSEGTAQSTATNYAASRFGIHGSIKYNNAQAYPLASVLSYGRNGRVSTSWTVPTNINTIEQNLTFAIQTNPASGFARPAADNESTWYIKNVKLEFANNPTPYTPAPEDIGGSLLTVPDDSGMGYNAQILNFDSSSLGDDIIGHYSFGTSFNGTSTRIACPEQIIVSYPLSMSCWIYGKNLSTTSGKYILSYNLNGNGFAGHAIGLYAVQGELSICYGGAHVNYGPVYDDTWYHVVLVVTSSSYKMYINNELVLNNNNVTITNPGSNWLTLGGRSNSTAGGLTATSYYFKGFIKDFRFYASELLADDVKILYNNSMSLNDRKQLSTYELVENENNREVLASGYFTTPYSNKTTWYKEFNNNGDIVLTGHTSVGSTYLPINPNGHTYEWEAIISVEANNNFLLGFERYDINKTSTSNQSCTYVINVRPSSNIVKKYYFGTVNLANDANGSLTDTIRLRILNDWSNATNKVATIHYISLREVASSSTHKQTLTTKGQVIANQFREYPLVTYYEENHAGQQASFYQNGVIESANYIEK